MIKYLSQIDFIKIIEQTVPLLLTGISILLFYYLKKKHEEKAKDKETRFALYEEKKLQTIVDFITNHNSLTMILDKGYHSTFKSNSAEEHKKFGIEAFEVFSKFYQSYFSLTFFLEKDEISPFEKIYTDTTIYFVSIKNLLKSMKENSNTKLEKSQLDIQRDNTLESNRENVRVIGAYFRTFLRS